MVAYTQFVASRFRTALALHLYTLCAHPASPNYRGQHNGCPEDAPCCLLAYRVEVLWLAAVRGPRLGVVGALRCGAATTSFIAASIRRVAVAQAAAVRRPRRKGEPEAAARGRERA